MHVCAQAAVLLSAGMKGHRYSFPHAKIQTAPPILNRVFGQTVDAQLQVRQQQCSATAGLGDLGWGVHGLL